MLETSTCNYDYFLFILMQTGKSLVRDYLKKIYIYGSWFITLDQRKIRYSLMVTTLKWNNVPHSPFRLSFSREPVSKLSFGIFSSETMSFTRKGHHTGATYSSIGLTRDLYSKENSFKLLAPSTRLMTPRTLLALLTTMWIWLLHDGSYDIVIPRSLMFFTLLRISPFGLVYK